MNYLEVFMEAILKLRQGKRHIITAIILLFIYAADVM